MRFDGAKKWYAAAALASVLMLVAGWLLLVSPQRQNAEDIGVQADAQLATNQVTQTKINALKAQYSNLPTLQKQLALVQTHMPQTPNEPSLLRLLTAAAKAAGVELVSVTPAPPTPLVSTGAAGKSTSTAPDLSAAGTVGVISLAIKVKGQFANTRLFLSNIEAMPRSLLVTNLSIARDDQAGKPDGPPPGTLDTTITGRVFTANPGQAAAAVAKTTGTAAAPATNG